MYLISTAILCISIGESTRKHARICVPYNRGNCIGSFACRYKPVDQTTQSLYGGTNVQRRAGHLAVPEPDKLYASFKCASITMHVYVHDIKRTCKRDVYMTSARTCVSLTYTETQVSYIYDRPPVLTPTCRYVYQQQDTSRITPDNRVTSLSSRLSLRSAVEKSDGSPR